MKHNQTYSYTGSCTEIVLPKGIFRLECWGAEGSTYNAVNKGGKGAYVAGTIKVKYGLTLYLYIGRRGNGAGSQTFNGGGQGQYTGGGGTDFRLIPGNWKDFESLKSRIIVAGGGGGCDSNENAGGGGTLEGLNSSKNHGFGGTQTQGGKGYVSGSFGYGGGYDVFNAYGNGGGGGGYFGGGSGITPNDYPGGGGSSFISGHPKCNAISKASKEGAIIPENSPIHYSKQVFFDTEMIDGAHSLPFPFSAGKEIGHSGNGNARITYIGAIIQKSYFNPNRFINNAIISSCFISCSIIANNS